MERAAELCAATTVPGVGFSAGVTGAGRVFYVAAGQEGVVAERLDSPHRPGRGSAAWRKIED